ncbi:MAG: hypothetical protein ACI8YQ_002991 [Polaribacter sp.]|jgi:hypothetical protein
MEQKYIDNFFKDKLEHREVAFSEGAWLAAEKMIVAEEQKRRWGGLGQLWFLLPFLIAGMLLYVYQTQPLDSTLPQNGMSVMPSMLPTFGKESTMTTLEANGNEHTVVVDKGITNNNNASPEGDASVVVAGTVVTDAPSSFSNKNNTKSTSTTKSSSTSNQGSVKMLVPPSRIEKSQKPVKKKTRKEVPMALNQNVPPIAIEEKALPSVITSDPLLAQSESTVSPIEETVKIDYEKGRVATLGLESPNYQIEKAEPVVKQTKLHYYKRNRFSVGLLSSAIVTPSFNDKIIGLSGMNIGATFSYRLNSRWSVNTDLLYEFHGRNYAFANGNNSLTYEYQSYSFGLDDNKYNVQVKQSHLLTVPLYMKYHIGRHGIDLGVQGVYTLGLRGKIEEETISSNETASTREAKTTWVDSDRISPFQFNIMLGYQLNLTKRLSVGLRSVIVPSRLPRFGNDDENAYNALEIIGIGNPDSVDGEKAPIPLFAHNAINFHFRIQYNLNPKVRHITKPLMGL